MESFQESLKLFLDAGCHLSIRTQLHILQLIGLIDCDLLTPWQQLFELGLSEVIKRVSEVKFKVILNGTVLDDPFQTVEVFIVFLFHVEVGDG